jgi:hypothetical protein
VSRYGEAREREWEKESERLMVDGDKRGRSCFLF